MKSHSSRHPHGLARLCTVCMLGACMAWPAVAQDNKDKAAAKPTQQTKMALCNKEATGKSGDERKQFMKQCLSAKKDTQKSKA